MTVYRTLLQHMSLVTPSHEFSSSDNNLTKRDSFPNIQVTEYGDLNNSPISNFRNKLRLNKVVRRTGRPKGTKKH